ncbi:MAG: thpR [Paucimonas sp.]|nr:thpR [Paucimonas sp.]
MPLTGAPPNAPVPASLRLFYALWPPPAVRTALAALLPAVQGRRVKPANLHITMAFLGQQAASNPPVLLEIADRVSFTPTLLSIDTLGYFKRSRVAWAGMHQVPSALLQARAALLDALRETGIDLDGEAAFRPHVTLARDAAPPALEAIGPIQWTASRIELVSSVAAKGGVSYEVLGR